MEPGQIDDELFYDRNKPLGDEPNSLDMFRGLPPYLVVIVVLFIVVSAGLLAWSCR